MSTQTNKYFALKTNNNPFSYLSEKTLTYLSLKEPEVLAFVYGPQENEMKKVSRSEIFLCHLICFSGGALSAFLCMLLSVSHIERQQTVK